jgi:uncharacterized protein (DUF934 family)
MPLLDAAGQTLADSWVAVAEDAALPGDAPALVSLARLKSEAEALAGRNAPLGVRLPSDTPPEAVADLLDRLDLVAIEFPKFRDGRGFTIARTLRERFGYKGDIRAMGHFLPDQFGAMIACGFTSFVTPPEHTPAQFAAATATRQPGQLLRRMIPRALEG